MVYYIKSDNDNSHTLHTLSSATPWPLSWQQIKSICNILVSDEFLGGYDRYCIAIFVKKILTSWFELKPMLTQFTNVCICVIKPRTVLTVIITTSAA